MAVIRGVFKRQAQVSHKRKRTAAIFTVNILAPTGSSCLACQMGTLSCSLMLDGAPLISLNDMMHSFNLASQEYAMTTTSPVIAGTHTVALLCTGLLNPDYVTFTMQATGRGMSAIVLF